MTNPRQVVQTLIDCGMTQSEIAVLADISQSSVSKLLNGQQLTVTHEKWSRLQILAKAKQKARLVS